MDMTHNIEDRQNVGESIYTDLKQHILGMSLKPGEKLSEPKVAQWYKVSRSPVRSALKKLESEGLVAVEDKSGTYVTRLDPRHIKSLIYLRSCVETDMIIKLATTPHPEVVATLKADLVKMADAFQAPLTTFNDLDNDFHRHIYTFSGLSELWNLSQDFGGHYYRFRVLALEVEHSQVDIYREHQEIIDVIEAGQAELVRDLVHRHVTQHLGHYLHDPERWALYEPYFTGSYEEILALEDFL